MLQKYKDKREEGFTIIEVLIVLAIAGLIILIVFLAVPALQRNSRNTQRTNDASLVAAGVNECLNNKNGVKDSCDEVSELDAYVASAKLQQLSSGGAPTVSEYFLEWGTKCQDDGTAVAGGGTRAFTVTFQVETSNGETPRCVGS